MLLYDGFNFSDLERVEAETEAVEILRGMWPGAMVKFDVEECPGGDWQQPVNSWVLYDVSDQKWFVWRALIAHPDSKIGIFYRYDLEREYPEIDLFHVEYATQRIYRRLFRIIQALRQISAAAPGPRPVASYDLAASMIESGTKSQRDVLTMFGEDDREAARQGLRRRLND